VRWDRRYQQLRGLKLARHLKAAGISVMEVERPKSVAISGPTANPTPSMRRQHSQGGEKAGEALGEPKSGDGRVGR
jgi:hypothetical protein